MTSFSRGWFENQNQSRFFHTQLIEQLLFIISTKFSHQSNIMRKLVAVRYFKHSKIFLKTRLFVSSFQLSNCVFCNVLMLGLKNFLFSKTFFRNAYTLSRYKCQINAVYLTCIFVSQNCKNPFIHFEYASILSQSFWLENQSWCLFQNTFSL